MEYRRNTIGIRERIELEHIQMKAEKIEAILAYVAMMSDIELPEDNETTEDGDDNV